MTKLSAIVCGLACAAALAACAHAPRRSEYRNLEVRLVSVSGGTRFPQWGGAETAALDPDVLFSGKDFAAIRVGRGGDDGKTPSLELAFTRAARLRFEDVTTRDSGRRIAFVIGGKIVTAPKILHPITTGLFEITGPSDSEIQEMYRILTRG